MEVNHTADHVTHAVVGGSAPIHMGISDSAEFFQILSSTLYSDQKLAVARETLCNAWDAHVEAGCTDTPIRITIASDKITIRDYGKGIHRDQIGPIYGVYGNSTKKNDGLQTGGFGLGCKAPFAYTDHFQVSSAHEGTKTIYSMSKSSAQVGGKPAIIPITSFPTTETGLEVSINMRGGDHIAFRALMETVIANGEMKALINEVECKTIPFSTAKHGFAILNKNPLPDGKFNTSLSICVRYGNVIYPLADQKGVIGFMKACEIMERLPKKNTYGGTPVACLILLAPPHSISVTPSRESLSMQEHTINTVNGLINNFLEYAKQKTNSLNNILLSEMVEKAENFELLDMDLPLGKNVFNRISWFETDYMITDINQMKRAFFSQRMEPNLRKKDYLNRINKAKSIDLLAYGKAHSLYRFVQRNKLGRYDEKDNWVGKHIVRPVMRRMIKNSDLNINRLFFVGIGECKQATANFEAPVNVIPRYARPNVVIHYVRKDVTQRIAKEGTLIGDGILGTLLYHVPRVGAKVKAAVEFFEKYGYNVIDLTKPLPGESIEAVGPAERVKSNTVRQLGLIALSEGIGRSGFHANSLYEASAKRVMKPTCVFLCSDTDGQKGMNRLDGIGDMSDVVAEMYGSISGVAKTLDQYTRYKEKGIEDGVEYVIKDVVNYITNSDVILNHITAHQTLSSRSLYNDVYSILLRNEKVANHFKLPFITDPQDKKYLALWNHILKNCRWKLDGVVSDTEKDIDSLPEHQATLDICTKIKNSKFLACINPYFTSEIKSNPAFLIEFINFLIK
jgi:hypothetical protein